MSTSAPDIGALLTATRTNALLGWVIVGLVVLTAASNLLVWSPTWALFAFSVALLIAVPPLSLRSPWAMIPWEVTLLAAIPILAHTIAFLPAVGESTVFGQTTMYLSVAALALIVAVELHVFTPVRMNVRFAVLFVVIATLAMAGIWAVVRWISDLTLGTTFILDPAIAETEQERLLMWEFVASTVAGLLAGVFFEYYVRRKARTRERLPSEVRT